MDGFDVDALRMRLMKIDPDDCKENQIKKKEKKKKTYLACRECGCVDGKPRWV